MATKINYTNYDVEGAKKLLKKIGYKSDRELKIWVMNTSRSYLTEPKIAGDMLKNFLEAVGIPAVVEEIEFILDFLRLTFPFFEGVHLEAILENVLLDHEPHTRLGIVIYSGSRFFGLGHNALEDRGKYNSPFVIQFDIIFANECNHTLFSRFNAKLLKFFHFVPLFYNIFHTVIHIFQMPS